MKTTLKTMRIAAITRLEHDGLVRRAGDRYRTTKRWRAAITRASFRLDHAAGYDRADRRVPIAFALLEVYGDAASDGLLSALIEVLLPIEAAERFMTVNAASALRPQRAPGPARANPAGRAGHPRAARS